MLNYLLILAFALLPSLALSQDEAPRAAATRIMHEVEEGSNKFEKDLVMGPVGPTATMISKNGEVVLGRPEIEDYFNRMVKGKAVLKSLASVARFTREPVIGADGKTLLWMGDSDDRYVFTSGLDLKIKTLFTFLIRRIGTEWKIQHIHFGFDTWDYPILATAKTMRTYLPPLSFLGALFVAWLFFRYRRKRAALLAGSALLALLAVSTTTLGKGVAAPEALTQALSRFWQDPAHAPVHPLFASITTRGQITQGLAEYLALKDQPTSTMLDHVRQVQVFEDSAVVIGTVNQLFADTRATFTDNFSAVFLSENGEWKLASYMTSSNLFDNPLLHEVRATLILGCLVAAVLGALLGIRLFRPR